MTRQEKLKGESKTTSEVLVSAQETTSEVLVSAQEYFNAVIMLQMLIVPSKDKLLQQLSRNIPSSSYTLNFLTQHAG